MHFFNLWLLLLSIAALSDSAEGLPIGFGHTQGGLEYRELRSKRFTIYHDHRTSNEARLMLNSMEAGLPVLQDWLDVTRHKTLPVISTAVGRGPSFANFITDAVELQTGGFGTRDLAWHELTHTMMYQHFNNWLGPAGSILHLAWLPSWFVEGLAEAISVSIGSDLQAGYERFHALTGQWPTYESLHNLYTHGPAATRGYAVSGSMVSYLLREHGSDKLPFLLHSFYRRSMPWHWPASLIPYTHYMPFDMALNEHYGINGEQLYKQYQKAATAYWQGNRQGKFLWETPGPRRNFGGLDHLKVRDDRLLYTRISSDGLSEREIQFDAASGWARSDRLVHHYPDAAESALAVNEDNLKLYVHYERSRHRIESFSLFQMDEASNESTNVLSSRGFPTHLLPTRNGLGLVIHEGETTRLCFVDHQTLIKKSLATKKNALNCPYMIRQPETLKVLGEQGGTLWFSVTSQQINGNQHSVFRWRPDARPVPERMMNNLSFTPLSLTFAKSQPWLLIGDHHRRRLMSLDKDGRCRSIADLEDTPLSIHGFSDGQLAFVLLHGNRRSIAKVNPRQMLGTKACPKTFSRHTSPMLLAMQNAEYRANPELAFRHASPWLTASQVSGEVNSTPVVLPDIEAVEGPARWRPRPVFAMPWIGGDTGGYNFGVLAIPLMDHMQNETLSLTALYGFESRFPTTELSLTSTRFWPIWTLDAFRYQAWNGQYLDPETERARSAYYDERGIRLTTRMSHARWRLDLRIGIKMSELKPYIGPLWRRGRLNEPTLGISRSDRFGSWILSNSFDAFIAPEGINHNADYNRLVGSTKLGRSFYLFNRTHQASLSANISRTRGKLPPRLQEYYRPLRIFIPGEPGGFNNINLPIVSGGGLFTARYGSNRAATTLDYSVPLWPNIDRLVRLFYLRQLQFSSAFSYGGAWYGAPLPKGDDLITSHSYKLDLLFNVKGINFNLGAGAGQVVGKPYESYFNFGFDNILDM